MIITYVLTAGVILLSSFQPANAGVEVSPEVTDSVISDSGELEITVEDEDALQAQLLLLQADSLLEQGIISEARQAYLNALQLKKQMGDSLGAAFCRLGLGKISFRENLFNKALKYLEEAEPALKENNLYLQLYELSILRGDIHTRRGKYEDALNQYRAALDLGSELNDLHLVSSAYQYMGKLSMIRNRLQGAEMNFLKALEQAPGPVDSGYAYISLSEAFTRQEKYSSALAFQDTAIILAQTAADTALLAEAYGAKAQTYRYLGDYIASISFYEKQLNLIKVQNDELGRARVMMNIAVIFELQKRYAQALDFMEEVVKILEELESPESIKAQEYLKQLRNR